MAKENKAGLYGCIAIVVIVVIAIVVGVIVANNNKPKDNTGSEVTTSEPSTTTTDKYSTVDESIEFGDFEGMTKLSKAIQNGEATGKSVKIAGIVSHPMSKYSIVQENKTGSQKIGTQFIIEDIDESNYPADGDKIVITGTVVEEEPLVFVIRTTSQYVETLEATDSASGSAAGDDVDPEVTTNE